MSEYQLTGEWTAAVQKAVWRTGLEADWVHRLIQDYLRKHNLAQNAANSLNFDDDVLIAHAGFRLIDEKESAVPSAPYVLSVQTFTPYGTKTPFFIYGDPPAKTIRVATLSSLPRCLSALIGSIGAGVAQNVPDLVNE